MIKLLEFLWSGCWHQWEYQGKIAMVDGKSPDPIGHKMVYKCKKCQKHKTERLV